ncbi:RraA family protein [Halorientalis marina]|jgi:regulator of RNase E activity RraA|uniref:RraA family protein n=1 Tax=Halorientalis marina TaxID=2931976 RepID=UPI001FF553DE|nr:RraA family protein [Halorientalis marina]
MEINDFDRPAADRLDELSGVSPNDLGHRLSFRFPTADIEYLGGERPVELIGSVLTVRIPPEDSTMVHKAIELAQPGDVIAIDQQGHGENAPWGEVTTRAALERGVAGTIVDGSITDSAAIERLGFPVYARGRSARTTRLHGTAGDINVPIQIGRTSVRPGDVVVGNADGLLFLDPDDIERAVSIQAEEADREREVLDRLAAGESLASASGAADLLDDE